MSNKPEIYLDSRGEVAIENLDELAKHFPRWADRAVNSAMKSEGYRIKNILQHSFDRGGPSGHSWEKLHPYTMRLRKGYRNRKRKRAPKMISGAPQKTANPLLKLKGGLKYKVDEEQKLLSVGYVDPSGGLIGLLSKHATGYEVKVSRSMQKLFFALGLPLKASTKKLEIPGRPLIEPVFESERERIADNLERKFFANMERYANG